MVIDFTAPPSGVTRTLVCVLASTSTKNVVLLYSVWTIKNISQGAMTKNEVSFFHCVIAHREAQDNITDGYSIESVKKG